MVNDAILPNALLAGVPYDLFWHLNPAKLEPFYKAQQMKAEAQSNRENTFAWMMGLYTMTAVGAVMSKHGKYPTKPIDLYEKPKSDAEKFADYVKAFRQRRAEERGSNS